MINAFLRRMYKYNFVSACFEIDSIMHDMDKKFLEHCCPQITVCIRYSLLSKAMHMGFVPGTIPVIHSCQFVTTTLDATLLLYAGFTDLNIMLLVFFVYFMLCMYYCFIYCF